MKHLWILEALPRAGSTPVAGAIGHYLNRTHGYFNAGEMINDLAHFPLESRGTIRMETLKKTDFDRMSLPQIHKAHQQRWSFLNSKKRLVFLKAFPDLTERKSQAWLERHSTRVFLRRRDLFQHCLSYMISLETERFYQKGGLRFKPRSVHLQFMSFLHFIRQWQCQLRHEALAFDKKLVYFEDFLKKGPAASLRDIGLTAPVDWTRYRPPLRQNPKDKTGLLKNPEAVISWYRSSLLNDHFPVNANGRPLKAKRLVSP